MGDNAVELIGYYGGDETHAMSAWSSTSRDLDTVEATGRTKRQRIPQMLRQLANPPSGKRHESPFEKSVLHFLVTADIASHIHALKHRIGVSINAESARYKELKDDKFYVPRDWPRSWSQFLAERADESFGDYHKCVKSLVESYGFDRKRAKESARYFLTYASQIDWDISFNFRSFVHFQELRNDPTAQLEIREIATEMLRLVRAIPGDPFKYSCEAFSLGAKVQPDAA